MPRITDILRKHTLWVGFAAVLAPLLVLLGLQYVWLERLDRVSAIAHTAALSNYLEAVGTEVQYFYRSSAERALNLPASVFTQGRFERAASYWKTRPAAGVKRLFLVDYTRERFGNFLVYNPERGALETAPASDEALAIIMACTPWQLLSYRGGAARAAALSVDERNPDYRIILNPITDDALRVVGVAGMILDEAFFTNGLLPSSVKKALPGFFPGAALDDVVVTVHNAKGELVLSTGEDRGRDPTITRRFPFVFADWTIGLHSPRSAPERWARASFAFNMTLSALLAFALMSGIVLALHTADRAMKLSEMKSDFVSNVSHELRTPLASIRVFAELLRLGRVPSAAKVQEYGEFIEAESRRLSRLIDNILDFSRIESGRKTYRFVPTDLREVVAATLRAFEVHLKQGGFRIDFEEGPGPLPAVVIDPDALGQALHNLLDNAVKYSGDSRLITVRLGREGGELLLSVRDRGIGIPQD